MSDETPAPAPPPRKRRWGRRLLAVLVGLLLLVGLGLVVLDTPIGHRLVADQVEGWEPRSGLRVKVGRIEGSLLGKARLRDVTLADPEGVFLRLPESELDWRPLNWFSSGLDVRELIVRRAQLLRRPKLRPGDPDAPILPDFDIRLDRLVIDDLTVAKGVAGAERKVDLLASADIRAGRAFIKAEGKLGGSDRLALLLDAEPDRDKFDLKLDYNAPAGGVLAALTGSQRDLAVQAAGKGGWRNWQGGLLAQRGGERLAALQLTARAGRYRLAGLVAPVDLLSGFAARAAGREVAVDGEGTFADRIVDGRLDLTGEGLLANAQGGVDLAENRFDGLKIVARNRQPGLLGADTVLEAARLEAQLDGPFRDLTVTHNLTARRLVARGGLTLHEIAQAGTARYDGTTLTLPLDLKVAWIVTGNAQVDPRLVQAIGRGAVSIAGSKLTSDNLGLGVPGIGAQLALRGDLDTGVYGLSGPVAFRNFALPDLGLANADATIAFGMAPGGGWHLRSDLAGRLARVDNPTLTTLAGSPIRFAGKFTAGRGQPLLIETATLSGSKLGLGLAGRRLGDGRTLLTGSGRHRDYGRFSLDANLGAGGPRLALLFAEPYPPAGLKNVRVALAPQGRGFRIETRGDSRLGPFDGVLGLVAAPGQPVRIAVERMTVWKTAISGALTLERGRATGLLTLAGGGIDATVRLMPQGGGQGYVAALTARDARFGGANPISIASGKIDASGIFGNSRNSIAATINAEGLSQGGLFIGRLAAQGSLTDGKGKVAATLSGRRGSRFNLQLNADIAPQRFAVLAGGDLAGRRIAMPRRAVLTAEDGGWRLAPAQVDFGGGRAVASGLFGAGGSELELALADMPLSLADIYYPDLGFGGIASGQVSWNQPRGALPSGTARLNVRGLTRSGLVLTSRPLDLALNASLGASQLDARAELRDGGAVRGRVQGRIAGLPGNGTLEERLFAGNLFAQLRYDGQADALWRLIALDAFDLTGPANIAADVTGTLAQPQFRGSLASDNLRLRSALIGSDITGIALRGRFAGSRLELTSLAGRTANGGQVSGSGSLDFSGLGQHDPAIDLKLAARNAQVLSRDDMAATVSGPLRIVSDGRQGTIAGRLALNTARWQLGRAASVASLPAVRTREINLPADIAPRRAPALPWRFLIDANGRNGVFVRGLGIDSEWSADIRIRGTTLAPAIAGRADLVRGGYEFAGRRFEMTRGRIAFDGGSPPNPRLDILAEAAVTGLNARVTVTGTSLAPEIAFSSVPALPEDELLARLLFGDSIAKISAPEAIQLAAALESLRGGGGLDPINKLRAAIGLDRLRIVGADTALGRGTGIAAGKYLGRRVYAEIISDGRGYSATQLEFRVTNWLAILASISTIGRESVNIRVSKDY